MQFEDLDSQVTGEKTRNTTFKKLCRGEWNEIETLYDSETLIVLDALAKLGGSEVIHQYGQLKFCGDVYDVIRNKLVAIGLVEPGFIPTSNKEQRRKNKKKNNKLSKDDIIRQNTLKSINNILDNTLKTFTPNKFNGTYGFNSPYAEIKIITLIYAANYLMAKSKINFDQCYELVLGMKKTLKNINHLNELSKTAYNDLEISYKKLMAYCKFKYSIMFDKYPRLCLTTCYDKIFPTMAIKPYLSQIQLMDEIKKRDTGLYCYKAMIGSGKTSVVIALSEYVTILRKQQQKNLQLIFTCSVQPVRNQVGKMAYNKQIPFGIAVVENNKVRIINNYSCRSDENRILIIADLDATIELLRKSQDYLLFVDEPTVGADQEGHSITKAVSKVFSLAPKQTILCSATLPNINEIPNLITYFKEKHNNPEIINICSKEAMIGCEIIKFDGTTIAPHNYCKTCDDLKIIINNLKEKPFIDRLYTAPVVYRLRQKMIENGLTNIIDLEHYFSDIGSLNQSNIQKAAIILLESLIARNNDSLVETICIPLGKISIEQEINNASDDEDDIGFVWEEKKIVVKNENPYYDLTKIFTEQAYRYLGGCLIAVNDPIKFAYDMSRELLSNSENASKIIDKYNSEMEKLEQCISKLDNIKNEDERVKKEQQIRNDHTPGISFPSHFRTNTPSHFMRYAPHMKDKIDTKLLQLNFNLENLPLDLEIPDWTMLLLFSGIGIYIAGNNILPEDYTKLILNMMADRKLAFLISDESICYGANYPLSHVVIEDEFSEKHSIGTIFQLIGRAGRVGQSWTAYAHVGDKTSQRIMNYIQNLEDNNISKEAMNINKTFENVVIELSKYKTSFTNQQQNNLIDIIKLSEVKPLENNTNQTDIFEKYRNYKNDNNNTSSSSNNYQNQSNKNYTSNNHSTSTTYRGTNNNYFQSNGSNTDSTTATYRNTNRDKGYSTYQKRK